MTVSTVGRVLCGLAMVGVLGGCEEGSESTVLGPSTLGLSVTLTPRLDTIFSADTVGPNDVVQLTATVKSAATGGAVTGVQVAYSSSDTSVATVSASGVVLARGFGEATVTADLPGKKGATARVVVVQRTSSVRITPGADTIYVDDPIVPGDSVRLVAQASDRDGRPVSGTRFAWRSSAAGVATVDAAGVVRALSLGTTTITATGANIAANAVLQVRPLVKGVAITAPVTRTLVSDTIQLTARATGQDDRVLAGRRFAWRSETPTIASVDSTGRVIVLAAGMARFTATTGFVTSTTSIEVLPRALTTLDVGSDFTCAVANLGRGYCWGREEIQRLGTAADSLCFDWPAPAAGSEPCTLSPRRFGEGITLRSVSAGGTSACGIGSDEHIYCWGDDALGQLGVGQSGSPGSDFVVRTTVSNIRFKTVTVGGVHACAISTTDAAYCWGGDASGQLGDARRINSTTPIPLAVGFESFRWLRLSAGDTHTCGIASDGSAYCWGSHERGQLGIGAVDPLGRDTPTSVAGGLTFTEISAGDRHTCGIATGGALYCWGANDSLQLGTSTPNPMVSPTPVLVPGIANVIQVSTGGSHTCAIVQGGQLYCWGSAAWGQLGEGSTAGTIAAPSLVSAAAPFRSVSAGLRHTCGIDLNNVAYCWGSNVFGALGNELQAAVRATPQRVAPQR